MRSLRESLPLTQLSKRQQLYGIENIPSNNCIPMDTLLTTFWPSPVRRRILPPLWMSWRENGYEPMVILLRLSLRRIRRIAQRLVRLRERIVSKGRTREKDAIVIHTRTRVPISNIVAPSFESPHPRIFVAWRSDIVSILVMEIWRVTTLKVESELKGINVIVVILFCTY